jgi:2-keto-4-pentenoate hydratase/2-oxohepta-3-ene-1,7-dioic acid hydratase in catechol pathway
MRIVRFQKGSDLPKFGWVLGNQLGLIEGDIFGQFRRLEAEVNLDDVRLMAPVLPTKILCVGRNYAAHVEEHAENIPNVPLLFLKPPSAVIGPKGTIILPPQSQQVEHEAELVVVIGKRGRWIPLEEAHTYVLGYTIGNDVTARDLQRRDEQWTRAKGFDTFCPLGPWIETEFDPADSLITCYVNNDLRQMASTHEMVFNVRQLIAFASSVMTLESGDLLFTGTPAGVSSLQDGDRIKIEIEGIGTLENSVTKEQPH